MSRYTCHGCQSEHSEDNMVAYCAACYSGPRTVKSQSPAWVYLARAVAVAEVNQYAGGALARAALQSLISECRTVIRMAQQEEQIKYRPGDCGNPDCCNIGMDGPCPECQEKEKQNSK